MNDERFLKDWLQDTSDTDSEPQAAADKVMAVVPHARQRNRWWPLLPGRRRTPNDDEAPTITWRTKFMLSPIKAITAGALVFALGGAFLIAQPFDGQPSSGPPAAELDVSTATSVSGTIVESTSSIDTDGTYEVQDGVIQRKGIHYTNLWETSDSRLSGTATYDADWIRFPQSDFQVEAATHVLQNADGRWVGQGSALAVPRATNTDIAILRGEGAYEGLTAYVAMDWTVQPPTIAAAIFPGVMPEAPEPLSE